MKISEMTKEEVDTAKNHTYKVLNYFDKELNLCCVYIPRGYLRDPILIHIGKYDLNNWGEVIFKLGNVLHKYELKYEFENIDLTNHRSESMFNEGEYVPSILQTIELFSEDQIGTWCEDYFEYEDMFYDTYDIFEYEKAEEKEESERLEFLRSL